MEKITAQQLATMLQNCDPGLPVQVRFGDKHEESTVDLLNVEICKERVLIHGTVTQTVHHVPGPEEDDSMWECTQCGKEIFRPAFPPLSCSCGASGDVVIGPFIRRA